MGSENNYSIPNVFNQIELTKTTNKHTKTTPKSLHIYISNAASISKGSIRNKTNSYAASILNAASIIKYIIKQHIRKKTSIYL